MSAFSSSKNHLWNAKPKDQPKKSSKKKTCFQIAKQFFFHFSSFWPLLLSNLITFLLLIHFKQFKVLKECHLKFYKSSLNYNSNIQQFLGVWELAFVAFNGFFFKLLISSIVGGHNFLNSIPFFMIFSVPNAPIKRVQVLFGHQKQWSPPLESNLPWAFKCPVTSRFTLINKIIRYV
jgi:hypothetical protein